MICKIIFVYFCNHFVRKHLEKHLIVWNICNYFYKLKNVIKTYFFLIEEYFPIVLFSFSLKFVFFNEFSFLWHKCFLKNHHCLIFHNFYIFINVLLNCFLFFVWFFWKFFLKIHYHNFLGFFNKKIPKRNAKEVETHNRSTLFII